jgi:hypothetical protein
MLSSAGKERDAVDGTIDQWLQWADIGSDLRRKLRKLLEVGANIY